MNKVLFKVDDFLADRFYRKDSSVSLNFDRFFKIIDSYSQIRISLGVIAQSLESMSIDTLKNIIARVRNGQIEVFNHSYSHSEGDVEMSEMLKGQQVIETYFAVDSSIWGAPRNDIHLLNEHTGLLFKRDIAITAYQELENVTDDSFVRYDNFMSKYQKEHNITKVYQMHPWVWDSQDFVEFEEAVQIMIGDGKEWIVASDYAR